MEILSLIADLAGIFGFIMSVLGLFLIRRINIKINTNNIDSLKQMHTGIGNNEVKL